MMEGVAPESAILRVCFLHKYHVDECPSTLTAVQQIFETVVIQKYFHGFIIMEAPCVTCMASCTCSVMDTEK